MPLITNLKNLKTEYTVEDFMNVLKQYPLSIGLWFEALKNGCLVTEQKLIEDLVKEANNRKFKVSSPFHVFYEIFQEHIKIEWDIIYNPESIKEMNENERDKSLMYIFHDYIIQRDNFQCQLCGRPLTLETAQVHHILRRYCSHKSEKKDIWPERAN